MAFQECPKNQRIEIANLNLSPELPWLIHKLSSYPELFMNDFKIKGHVSDLNKSEHVPDFIVFCIQSL